jgi:hypothetical protein
MTSGLLVGHAQNINLGATGTQEIIGLQPQNASDLEHFFLPLYCLTVLRTLTGPAMTISPKFRIGANANHNDVCPVFTVPLAAPVGVVAFVPIVAAPFVPPNIRSAGVSIEVTVAAIGPTAILGDVILIGVVTS